MQIYEKIFLFKKTTDSRSRTTSEQFLITVEPLRRNNENGSSNWTDMFRFSSQTCGVKKATQSYFRTLLNFSRCIVMGVADIVRHASSEIRLLQFKWGSPKWQMTEAELGLARQLPYFLPAWPTHGLSWLLGFLVDLPQEHLLLRQVSLPPSSSQLY